MSELAREWGLDTLSCWFDDAAACDAALAHAPPLAYAVRASASQPAYLVLVLHRGQGALERTLFRRVADGHWSLVQGERRASFAELLRAVLPPRATPLVWCANLPFFFFFFFFSLFFLLFSSFCFFRRPVRFTSLTLP